MHKALIPYPGPLKKKKKKIASAWLSFRLFALDEVIYQVTRTLTQAD
jgi:hypothetical protein